MTETAQRIVLASRPVGEPTLDNFRLEELPTPQPGPGQMLLRTLWLSLDPCDLTLWVGWVVSFGLEPVHGSADEAALVDRKAAERTVAGLWAKIGELLAEFS